MNMDWGYPHLPLSEGGCAMRKVSLLGDAGIAYLWVFQTRSSSIESQFYFAIVAEMVSIDEIR